ncbi:MAG: preprotein translocase subunit SecG [Prevotella sp.]|nr:preprotein translocase subunit SecG [Prevotella sp.]
MYTLFVILIVIAAILMIGIVLIQESKGGGLSSSFAGYNQVAGVRKTTDFIEKATWGLAAAMVIISIICAWVAPTATADSSVMENVENPVTNPNNLPGFGASQQKDAKAPATDAADAAAPAAEAPAAEAPAEKPAQPAN